jgi:hypothetical protein
MSGMTVASLKVATHRALKSLLQILGKRGCGHVITTPDLIESLATSMTPVQRLWPPADPRGLLAPSCCVILGLLAVSEGIRPHLLQRLQHAHFTVGTAASLFTGMSAAIAAFMLSLPDRSCLWVLLPTPALLAWLSTIGYQCLTDWISLDPSGIRLGETARCFATLVLTSLPLSLTMLVMLRYAGPLRPISTVLTGSLAVAAIMATALSLFHEPDATVMILLWNLSTAVMFIGLAGAFRRKMFSGWRRVPCCLGSRESWRRPLEA